MNANNTIFGVGDIVLVSRGQKTSFFEIIKLEENYAWISNGWVQIKRTLNDIELICKAENRQDKRVPFNKFVE